MIEYICLECNFNSHLKSNYIRHLNTKKHKKRMENKESYSSGEKKNIPMSQNEPKMSQNEPKRAKKIQKKNKNLEKKNKISEKKNKITEISENIYESDNSEKQLPTINPEYPETTFINKPSFLCKYCNKKFKTNATKRKHELHRCKENMSNDILVKMVQQQNEVLQKQNEDLKKQNDALFQEKKEKKKLYKQIESLLHTVGNVTNNTTNNNNTTNITQNIHINNFGEEDVSHLSNHFMTHLLKGPCKMIQNAIKYIHFNENKPENHNILITNVKSKHLKVLKNNQWCYENKQDIIEDMIDKNYYILDGHYQEEGHKELNNFENSRYREFQNNYDNQNKKLHTQLKDDTELILINETKTIESIKQKDISPDNCITLNKSLDKDSVYYNVNNVDSGVNFDVNLDINCDSKTES